MCSRQLPQVLHRVGRHKANVDTFAYESSVATDRICARFPPNRPTQCPNFLAKPVMDDAKALFFLVRHGGPYRTRTCDPLRVMQVRYQLR